MKHASADLLPLVISLHGRLGDGAAQDKLSHFSTVAAREKFLLALPDGYGRSWADSRGITPAAAAKYDDVLFLSDLIAWFVANHHADPKRVYVSGMSNGGFMTMTAACRLSDKIAAFAVVGATAAVGLDCSGALPTSGMVIMGDEDPLVPIDGGLMEGGKRGRALSAKAALDGWAKTAGCKTYTVGGLTAHTTLGKWEGCAPGVALELVTVQGGGHTWPNGWQYLPENIVGKTTHELDATERIWNFFQTKHR